MTFDLKSTIDQNSIRLKSSSSDIRVPKIFIYLYYVSTISDHRKLQITYIPAPYYLTKRGLSYKKSTSIIGNKGLVNYVHDYDENLASKVKAKIKDENT